MSIVMRQRGDNRNMRVLVTGGAGFIGSHVVEALIRDGHEAVVVDNLSHGLKGNVPESAIFIEGDILHREQWLHRVGKADVLIHLAAQISVPISETHPEEDVRTNVLGTVAMLRAARDLGCQEFRLASSAAVYGNNPRVPLTEEEAGEAISYYGLDKWIAERYVRHEEQMGGLTGVILRLANVYGPRQRTQGEGGVVAIFAESLARGVMPVIDGDGLQTRDFIAAGDVARAFCFRLGDPGASGIYNIGTESATTVLALWETLAQEAGVAPDGVRHGPSRAGDIRHSRLKIERALAWGFRAHVPLSDGLAETYRYFQKEAHRA